MATGSRRGITGVDVLLPRIQVIFHSTEKGGIIKVENGSWGSGQQGSLYSCTTVKDISNPEGQFVIHLSDFQRYDRQIRPMDLVTIKMQNHFGGNPSKNQNIKGQHSGGTSTVMIGVVNSIRRKRLLDPRTGKPSIFCEIKGFDFGRVFKQAQIRYLPWLSTNEAFMIEANPIQAMISGLASGLRSGGEIDSLIFYAINVCLARAVNINFTFNSNTHNFRDVICLRMQSGMGFIPFNYTLQAAQGSVWDIVRLYANEPWNEIWVDTVDNPAQVIGTEQASSFSSPLTAADDATYLQRRQEIVASGQNTQFQQFLASNLPLPLSSTLQWKGGPDNANAYTTFFARRKPFDQSDWDLLRNSRYFVIDDSDISEQDIGVSGDEVYNYFWTWPKLAMPKQIELEGIGVRPILFSKYIQFMEDLTGTGDQLQPQPVYLNPTGQSGLPQTSSQTLQQNKSTGTLASYNRDARANAVEVFGFRPLENASSIWRTSTSEQSGGILPTMYKLTMAMANWNKRNSLLKSGSITIKGTPPIRVGDMLLNNDENEEYYVESVMQTYMQYEPLKTTLFVTRGQPKGPVTQNPGAYYWGNAMADNLSVGFTANDQSDSIAIQEIYAQQALDQAKANG